MAPLELSADDASRLKSLVGSRTLPQSIEQWAQIMLACTAGNANTADAKHRRADQSES